jgi:hypothetical protein
LPHSEIHGSKLVRSSPWLIAAYHVLHRLSAPRHPPDALKSLDRSHHQCPPLLRPAILGRPVADVIDKKDQFLCRICLTTMRSSLAGRGVRQPPLARRPDKSFSSRCQRCQRTPRDPKRCHGSQPKLLSARPPSGRPEWWSQTGSNRRPPACKAGALPTELWPQHATGPSGRTPVRGGNRQGQPGRSTSGSRSTRPPWDGGPG